MKMKHARDMDEVERAAALQELIRGARPVPPPIITEADETPPIRGSSNPSPSPKPADPKPRRAKDMSDPEIRAWFAEHKKKFA
jgi:hypothetical protein